VSVAGTAGSILGLMAWKNDIQDIIALNQKILRPVTTEVNFWNQQQNEFTTSGDEADDPVTLNQPIIENNKITGYEKVDMTSAEAWQVCQNTIDNVTETSQYYEQDMEEMKEQESTINDEITAEQSDNKQNDKDYYGNPFAS
jgi:hypothetical protein